MAKSQIKKQKSIEETLWESTNILRGSRLSYRKIGNDSQPSQNITKALILSAFCFTRNTRL
ncbi:hypothetical protein IX339_001016 [Porphyromonas levii]|nr:hypothetical protein [Porphyromonas levii]MBR8764678.1 hypothetical protein [Porphyromonas levii]